MKFARDFDTALKKGEYPQEWLNSVISYRQLKKCIKKVQRELQGLGLDPEILEQLWQNISNNEGKIDTKDCPNGSGPRPYSYSISNELATFTPKLTVAIDPRDGSPIDAWLSAETRDFLRGLPRSQPSERQFCVPCPAITDGADSRPSPSPAVEDKTRHVQDLNEVMETVEVPLTSDNEFFQILKQELNDLDRLQETQQKQLSGQIVRLGSELTSLTEGSTRKSKAEIEAWREIFRLYIEAQVFFSTNEQETGTRTSMVAQQKLAEFIAALSAGRKRLKLSTQGATAVSSFLGINSALLHFMKFQEINRTALTKIMKKFDKRTALHATAQQQAPNNNSRLPIVLASEPFIAQDLAKATCFTIQEQLLPIIPQLNDYLCPVCFSISYKPVRLRCTHVFCIRCLIVMQRAKQNHCPLCRGNVVLEANSDHLDTNLMDFLKAKFPIEVKIKDRENQYAAGVDEYGEDFDKCVVM